MTILLLTGPWQEVALDLCLSQVKAWLIAVDYYSRWIEILNVSSTTSAACIAKLKDTFVRCGIPIELVSDNSPQLSLSYFNSFAEKYGFTHVTSSQHMPNANGEAERAVQTAKRILIQKDLWLGRMVYPDTVIAASGCTSAQLMIGRHIRMTLPTLPWAVRPSWPNPDLVRQMQSSHASSTTTVAMGHSHCRHCAQVIWLGS